MKTVSPEVEIYCREEEMSSFAIVQTFLRGRTSPRGRFGFN